MHPGLQAVIDMYRQGWFLMHDDERGVTEWVQSARRALIPLDERFHVPRSTRQAVARGKFEITVDTAFSDVIHGCWQRDRDGGWLHAEIVEVFLALHEEGIAHSVEAWLTRDGSRELVGGLYGVALGRIFAGESMFSRPEAGGSEASKVCLVRLVEELRARKFVALDSQLRNPHMDQFGLYEIDREEYVAMLAGQQIVCESWRK
ncbi:MAG: leucyl/phenylalanyl-tRNA--protein transferase [Phycisphaerae bacterium]